MGSNPILVQGPRTTPSYHTAGLSLNKESSASLNKREEEARDGSGGISIGRLSALGVGGCGFKSHFPELPISQPPTQPPRWLGGALYPDWAQSGCRGGERGD